YPEETNPPAYRILRTRVFGEFFGPFQGQRVDEIPSESIEEEHRENENLSLFTMELRHGVTHYETLLASGDGDLQAPWAARVVGYYQNKLPPGWALNRACRAVTRATLAGVLDQVR